MNKQPRPFFRLGARFAVLLMLVTAMAVASGSADAARKRHVGHSSSYSSDEAAFWGGLGPAYRRGTPSATRAARTSGTEAVRNRSQRSASRPVARGSSTYIPDAVPSSGAGPTPQQIIGQPSVQPYNPPPITTFGDRVNNAIQSYPLQRGLGNNPTNMQQYIRQNAN